MKKSIAFVVCALLLAVSGQAAVTVSQGSTATKHENGYVVRLSGDAATVIDYNGVKITVPQGVKAVVRQNKDGSVRITGLNLTNVKVNGNTISSRGMVSFSVSRTTGALSVERGTLAVRDASGNTTQVVAGASVTAAAAQQAVPAFVSEALEPSTVSQQAVQNVTEEKVLSPSAPR